MRRPLGFSADESSAPTTSFTTDLDLSRNYPWWKKIAGIFADDPAFEEAMGLGREWRQSFRGKATTRER
jgi:hypothetical protein